MYHTQHWLTWSLVFTFVEYDEYMIVHIVCCAVFPVMFTSSLGVDEFICGAFVHYIHHPL